MTLRTPFAALVVAFPPVALFLREPPDFVAGAWRLRQAAGAAAAAPWVAAAEALRSWLFWGLAIAFFLDVITINGTLTHIVPLLTDRGLPPQVAIAALSGTGFALIFGRILSGWCLDRFWGPYVAITFFILPMIGIGILMSGAAGFAPFLGAIACGLGIGAEIELMAFFTSRYFGLRDYAKLYGTMFGIFALGVGIGPALSGASFDRFHAGLCDLHDHDGRRLPDFSAAGALSVSGAGAGPVRRRGKDPGLASATSGVFSGNIAPLPGRPVEEHRHQPAALGVDKTLRCRLPAGSRPVIGQWAIAPALDQYSAGQDHTPDRERDDRREPPAGERAATGVSQHDAADYKQRRAAIAPQPGSGSITAAVP